MANHHPIPMAAVKRPQRIVGIFERPLARPASPPSPSPGRSCSLPGAGAVVDVGVGAVAFCPGSRLATTTRRSLAEYFGLQVVSVSVGVGVGLSTSTWFGFTTLRPATV